jgi:hypothetical protein
MGSATVKVALPVSHLLENRLCSEPLLKKIEFFEGRDVSFSCFEEQHLAFHSELDLLQQWPATTEEHLLSVINRRPQLTLLTFHAACCYDAPGIDNGRYIPGGRRLEPNEMLHNSAVNCEMVRDIIPTRMDIGVENNNYFSTGAYETVTDGIFLGEIIKANNLSFLLDFAHAQISAVNKGQPFQEYFASLPLDRIIQIHISEYGIRSDGTAYDKHGLPTSSTIEKIGSLLKQWPTVQYITPEYYEDVPLLVDLINQIKELV